MKDTQMLDNFTSLETQLHSSVRLQLENTRKSIQSLSAAPDRMREAGSHLAQVTDLCMQSESLIDNYPFIKQVSRTHQNFLLTKRVYDEFCALDARVERCASLLEADQESGRPDNLLLVYYYLSRLELFRRQTLEMMRDAPSTAVYTIKRYFKKLDDLTTAFEEFFWKLPRQLFSLAESGQPTYIVMIAKVLSAMDVIERPKFNAILDDLVSTKFSMAISSSGASPMENPGAALEALLFWQNDLLMVRNEIVPRFPPSLNIMDFFILTYHRNIHSVLAQCLMGRKLGSRDILDVIGWVRTYHDEMAAQFAVSAEDLEPRLLDDREDNLIAEYVTLSRVMINEWISNLLASEAKLFAERVSLPETDVDDQYVTPAGMDLFQIVKQHIEAPLQASRGRLVLEIIGECVKSVNSFLSGMNKALDTEKAKYFEKPDSVPQYFEDYVIMLGNTCLKWVSYLDDLVVLVEERLAEEYILSGTKLLKSLGDGFVNLAKVCTNALVDIIFQSVKPAIQQLFTPPWYGGEGLMAMVLATFDDYFKDFERHMDNFLLSKLVVAVMEKLFFSHLQQLRGKNCKLKMPQASSLLNADVASIIDFFSNYRESERVKKAMDPLARFITLVCSSQKMLFLEFVAFWKLYPDIPVSLLEDVLSRRDDLDRQSVKEIIDSCRKKTEEEKLVETPTSIFSKIK